MAYNYLTGAHSHLYQLLSASLQAVVGLTIASVEAMVEERNDSLCTFPDCVSVAVRLGNPWLLKPSERL
jgi:hypothetical protein